MIAMWRRRRLSRAERLDLLETLSDAGCAACRAREGAVRRWLWTYENDSAGDLTVRLLMERTLGMCAAHTRRVLALGASSSWLAKTLFADVARAARTAVVNGEPPTEPCPPCRVGADAAQDRIDALVVGLRDAVGEPDIATYFAESDGLCVRHTQDAMRRANPTAGRQLATTLAKGLSGDPLSVLVAVAGYDPDIARVIEMYRAATSAQNLAAAPDTGPKKAPAAEAARHGEPGYVASILAARCCPPCAAADRAEWRTLRRDEPVELCARHLAMYAADGVTDKVSAVIADTARPWLAAVEAYLARRGAGRLSAPFGRRGLQVRAGSCAVCRARSSAETAEIELLVRIGADPAYEPTVARAHGVCVRHALSPELAGARGARWRRLLVTRLEELTEELERSRRADTWAERDVPRGAEATAWQRAPTLLDGAILGPPETDGAD